MPGALLQLPQKGHFEGVGMVSEVIEIRGQFNPLQADHT